MFGINLKTPAHESLHNKSAGGVLEQFKKCYRN